MREMGEGHMDVTVNVEDLLKEVFEARQASDAGAERYRRAVMAAHLANISNTRIARRAGVSEAAIRLMVKRGKEKS